jgi:uncharacterized lipoprotein YajG
MSPSRLFIAGLLMIATLSSCAYQAQVIRLNPAPPKADATAAANAGDHEVILITRDARSSQEIGRRAGGSREETAITTDTDIAALLQTEMTKVLKGKGYRALSAGPSTVPTLEVALKELSYLAFDAAGERKVKIQVRFETFIRNGPKSFRNTFQSQQERKILFEPVAKSNEEWINETFADAFQQIANDSRIYSYLE